MPICTEIWFAGDGRFTAARGRVLSYSQLLDRVTTITAQLKAMGIGRNDRVTMVMSNGPKMAVAFCAVSVAATVAPNGKINRRMLPDPGHNRPDLDQPYVPSGTPFEQRIAAIWAAILGIDRVGIYDNFLELGGNSLMAGQIVVRLGEAFRAELRLRTVFDEPTVVEMTLNVTEVVASHE